MIHLSNYQAFINYKDLQSSRNSGSNLDKPSYPNKLRLAMSKFVDDLETKSIEIINKHPWINSISTNVLIDGSSITYSIRNQHSVSFDALELGRYHIANQIWSWSWIDEQNQFVNDADSQVLRDWAVDKGYEFMSKANWYATYQDTIEASALCVALKSGIGIEINERGNFKYFYILLKEV